MEDKLDSNRKERFVKDYQKLEDKKRAENDKDDNNDDDDENGGDDYQNEGDVDKIVSEFEVENKNKSKKTGASNMNENLGQKLALINKKRPVGNVISQDDVIEQNFLSSIEKSLKKRKVNPLQEQQNFSKQKLIKLLQNEVIHSKFLEMLEIENCSDDDIKLFLNPIFQIIVLISERNFFKMQDILIKKLEKISQNTSLSLEDDTGKLSIPMLLWGSLNKIFQDKLVALKDNKFRDYIHVAIKSIIDYPQRQYIIHKLLKLFNGEINFFKAVIASICLLKQDEESEAEILIRELKDLVIEEGQKDSLEVKGILNQIKDSLQNEYKIDLKYISNV